MTFVCVPKDTTGRYIAPEEATDLDMDGCTGITELTPNEGMKHIYMRGCTGITDLTPNDGLEGLYMSGCTQLAPVLYHDPRGYELRYFKGLYISGCRLFRSADAALDHWGAGTYEDAARGQAYREAIRENEESLK